MRFSGKKLLGMGVLLLLSLYARAQELSIRILSSHKSTSVVITPSANYTIYLDEQPLNSTFSSTAFYLILENGSIKIKNKEQQLGKCKVIKFRGKSAANNFKIKSVVPESRVYSFDDHLEVSVSNNELKIINKVELDAYLGGVIESESAAKHVKEEFYKVQAILCRTYALSHLRRHEAEGYQLCDQVHCQAYKSRTKIEVIQKAVQETKGLIIVDSELQLITAAFHSNCGGQTMNSEDVWSLPTSYLKSVIDTFCLQQAHATWGQKITREDWLNYLQLKYNYPVNDSVFFNCAIRYCPRERESFLVKEGACVPLKAIRFDWQLKSTYFTIDPKNDIIIIKGRGFGHGVGLCQEGAMRMAQLGYSYKDIIAFYYKDIHIVDLSLLDFFREEN